jgi:hypothetical protein
MREMSDLSGVLREGSWIAGCIAAATAFCYFAPEYGYSPVPFFSVSFYLLTALLRLAVRAFRRLWSNLNHSRQCRLAVPVLALTKEFH